MNKKTIVLGVCGGIAAYKSAQLASSLYKKGYDVHVIMTKNATEFITPMTFETLTHNRVSVGTFDRNFQYDVNHISLAKRADLFVVAPASANCIAKFAHGLADDMLTTTFLAASCPKLIAPAMNTGMLNNLITQHNIEICKEYGMTFVESDSGYLACGDIGKGRLAEIGSVKEIFTSPKTDAAKHMILPIKKELNPFDMTDRRCIRIVFDGRKASEPLIANLVEATGEKVNILCANTKSVGGVGFGQMIVELPKEDEAIERVLKYIRENGVNFHELQREEAKSV